MERIEKISDIQTIGLKMLDAASNFFDKNEIKYSLGYGTMLGAARHKGFIPWDDDIDIFMMRDQYNKFMECAKKNRYINDSYKIILPGDDNYIYPFIKIVDTNTIVNELNVSPKYSLGIWIDVFPIDFCFNDFNKNKKLIKERKIIVLNLMRNASIYGETPIRTILKNIYLIILKIIGKNIDYWKKKSLNIPYINCSEFCGVVVWAKTIKDIYPREYFLNYTNIFFENKEYSIFENYDKILSWYYGEYMKLPPENERKYHNFEAYVINNNK